MFQNRTPDILPPELQELVEQELKDGEQLLWVGQPVFSGVAAAFVIPTGIGFMSGVVFLMFWCTGIGAPLWFVLLAVPFLLIGLSFLCSPFFEWRRMKNTIYAITDRRAIIFIKKSRTTEIVSYTPDELGMLRYNDHFIGQSADIIFEGNKTTKVSDTGGFQCIPSARKVERLLKDLAAKAPKEDIPLEQHDDPPILRLIGRVPREIPLTLRLYLRQYSEDSPFALFGWLIAGGLGFSFIGVGVIVPDMPIMVRLMCIGMSSPFAIVGLWLVFYAWFVGGIKTIRFLQDGIATKVRLLTTFPTGKQSDNTPQMQIDFEYQVDGTKYKVSLTGFDISRLTDSPCKVVFYDPVEPQQSMLLDQLPRGIYFDELTERFRVNPLRVIPAFFMAAFVCGEIVTIIVLAMGVF